MVVELKTSNSYYNQMIFFFFFLLSSRFWLFKLILLAAMCSGAFFIPDQDTFLNGMSFLFCYAALFCTTL